MVADEISENSESRDALKMRWPATDREWDVKNEDAEVVEQEIFPESFLPRMEIISVFGMAGIGKTTIVRKIFADPSISCHFDHRVWVTLGPKYQSEDILVDMLAQIYPDEDRRHIKGDPTLSKYLCGCLSSKRCLIVLDDIWTSEPLDYLEKLLPEIHGKVLLTTRIKCLEDELEMYDILQQVCLLSKKESWKLFCQKVFGGGSCPPKFQKVGQKISENCEGLPLLILTVADILSKKQIRPSSIGIRLQRIKVQFFWRHIINYSEYYFRATKAYHNI